jgi:hypothetical protein
MRFELRYFGPLTSADRGYWYVWGGGCSWGPKCYTQAAAERWLARLQSR